MAVDRSFVETNRAARARLREVVARLTEADLGRVTGDGWTVAAGLAHVAFWDRRAQVLVEKWLKGENPAPSEVDVHTINDAAHHLICLIPPRAAAQEAVNAAEAIDRALEDVGNDLLATILATETPSVDRAHHRVEHLDDIERLLAN